MNKLNKIFEELLEGVEYRNVSDDDEYWDRIKVIVTDENGNEVGYAIIEMAINETEFGNMGDGDGEYSEEEFDKHFPNGGAAKIEYLEVYKEYRQKGYAKILMDSVIKYIKSRGEKTIYLLASPIGFTIDLESLSNFYKQYGFDIIKDFGNSHDMVSQLESVKEDLTYSHTTTKGVEDDEYEIGKALDEDYKHNLNYKNDLGLDAEELDKIKNISPGQLVVEQGEYDGEVAQIIINMPWDSPINDSVGLNVNLQVLGGSLYQIHIFLSQDIRGLGLGYKIFKTIINEFGHLYSSPDNRINDNEIPRIWEKLDDEPNIESYSNDGVNIAILNTNPNKDELLALAGITI